MISTHAARSAVTEQALAEVLGSAEELLQDFSLGEAFSSTLSAAFGSVLEPVLENEVVEQVRASLAEGRDDWPTVELRSASELQGALGAYAAATRTIYLSAEFVVANAATPENILAVFLEELGHDLENRFGSGGDAAGDEGAIFSALVRGESLSEAQLAALRAEDDQATLLLDGQLVTVERASLTVNVAAGDVNDGDTSSIANLLANRGADGLISLREAIAAANNTAGADEIDFDGGGTIALDGTALSITDSLTVNGPGADQLTVDAQQNSRGFIINDGTRNRIDVTLDGLTITRGVAAGNGGGINNQGENLTVSNATVSDNIAGDGGEGGGISSNSGSLSVINSTVSDNSIPGNRSEGGGIFSTAGSLSVINSTVSGNTTTGDFSLGGGIFGDRGLSVSNSTISGNSLAGNSGRGGGIFGRYGTVNVSSSIVSGNTAQQGVGDEIRSERIFNGSNNVLGDNSKANADAFSGFTPDPSNLTATSDGNTPTALSDIIDPLASNGGPTQTHALVVDSPAINAGSNPDGLATDQRGPGFARTSGSATDIGAFERIKREQRGDDGINYLFGDAGDDALFGEGDLDKLYGGNGNDCLHGGDGNDFLYGQGNNDELFGEGGIDYLFGDAGTDILDGGADDDFLYGDAFFLEKEHFVLRAGDGNDTIYYYNDGQDKFLLDGLTFGTGATEVQAVSAFFGLNTELRIGGSGGELLATLSGINSAVIDATDFI